MTYNEQGKRTSLENLAGQVTTTAWDQFACTPVGELISAAKNAKSAKHASAFDDGNQTLVTTATGIWSVTYNGEDFEAEDSSCYDVELLSYDTIESFLQDEAEAYFDKVLKEWHDANNAKQKEEETKGRHKEFERIKSEYDKKRKGK